MASRRRSWSPSALKRHPECSHCRMASDLRYRAADTRRARWGKVAALILAGALFGVGMGWAGRSLLLPPPVLSEGAGYSTVLVEAGTVQRSLNLNASAKWSGGPQVLNSATGVVTEHRLKSGERINAGDVLYTVDLQPVVVIEGKVPVFRDLVPGYEGKDVSQFQAFLMMAGQRQERPSGRFDDVTLRQVKSWQRAKGVPATGTIPAGSLVVVPALPGVLWWGASGAVGARVGPGSAVAQIIPPQPKFSMVLPENQRGLVRSGMAVAIRTESATWMARLGTVGEPGLEGSATASLLPPKGERSICKAQCHEIPLSGIGSLPSTVVVIQPQSGPVVPTAALAVAPGGSTVVVTRDGRRVPVRVVASAAGRALVTGIEVGQHVRVPGASQ